jgi:WD40 repeat protein
MREGFTRQSFSPDGAQILGGGTLDGAVRVWDAASGKELLVLDGHEGAVYAAAFSPDGTRIVSGSEDDTARVWDAVSGKELFVLPGHKDGVSSAAFSPDGARIISGSYDGTVRVWFVGKNDAAMVAHACELLPRDLSPKAIKRFNLDPAAPWPCAERAKTLWPHPTQAATNSAAGPGQDAGAAGAQ